MFRTEISRDPGKEPHGMAEQNDDTCDLDITLYHWTHWIYYDDDNDLGQIILATAEPILNTGQTNRLDAEATVLDLF